MVTTAGTLSCASSFLIAFTASPSETPGAVSNEMLAAGNCATWLTCSGASWVWIVEIAPSGVGAPLAAVM